MYSLNQIYSGWKDETGIVFVTQITLFVFADLNKLLNLFGQKEWKNVLDPTFMQCIFKDCHTPTKIIGKGVLKSEWEYRCHGHVTAHNSNIHRVILGQALHICKMEFFPYVEHLG